MHAFPGLFHNTFLLSLSPSLFPDLWARARGFSRPKALVKGGATDRRNTSHAWEKQWILHRGETVLACLKLLRTGGLLGTAYSFTLMEAASFMASLWLISFSDLISQLIALAFEFAHNWALKKVPFHIELVSSKPQSWIDKGLSLAFSRPFL